jgi:hypothetical protein
MEGHSLLLLHATVNTGMLTLVRFRLHFMHWAIKLLPNFLGSNETVNPILAVVICYLGEGA